MSQAVIDSAHMTRPASCSAPAVPRSRSASRMRAARLPLVLAASAMLLLPAAPAAASRNMWSVFEDHNALVRATPAQRQRTLNEIRLHMGADTLRIEVKWNEVAPQPR